MAYNGQITNDLPIPKATLCPFISEVDYFPIDYFVEGRKEKYFRPDLSQLFE